MDLGCGPGNSTAVLRERWPQAGFTGLDSSADMIERARRDYPECNWIADDITAWASHGGEIYDVVFSNAALQWVEDHAAIYPQLLKHVAPGGALAVQIPGNIDALPHHLMRVVAASPAWREHFPPGKIREWHHHEMEFYHDVLAPS